MYNPSRVLTGCALKTSKRRRPGESYSAAQTPSADSFRCEGAAALLRAEPCCSAEESHLAARTSACVTLSVRTQLVAERKAFQLSSFSNTMVQDDAAVKPTSHLIIQFHIHCDQTPPPPRDLICLTCLLL